MGDPAQSCGRAPKCALDYQAKLSGPLLDRIDLQIEVASVSASDLSLPPPREDSKTVAKRVAAARERQRARYGEAGPRTNAEADGELLNDVAKPDAAGEDLLVAATDKFRLSARGYHRVLKVARTIADLAGREHVAREHIAESLSYRRLMTA